MFGRKKMYKKGYEDAMKAYEQFGQKQEEALKKIRQEIKDGNKKIETALAELGKDIYAIYDYLDHKEKEALYHLQTPLDIKDLEDEEKRLLLAILFQLAQDEGDRYSEYQHKYILSVKNYLGITNPQTDVEYSAIENIDSIDVQKVFMKVILEFLYLQNEDELTDSQEELFECFSVNKRHAIIIEHDVVRRYSILGPDGIAENYGNGEIDITEDNKEIISSEIIEKIKKIAEGNGSLFFYSDAIMALCSSIDEKIYIGDDIHSKTEIERKATAVVNNAYSTANSFLSAYSDKSICKYASEQLYDKIKPTFIELSDILNCITDDIKNKHETLLHELIELVDLKKLQSKIEEVSKNELSNGYYSLSGASSYYWQIEYTDFEHDPPGLFGKRDWNYDCISAITELDNDFQKLVENYSECISNRFRSEILYPVITLLDKLK